MSLQDPFKEIHYRGVLLVFKLPQHWSEEYGPEGGGCFYDPADESVTLRLSVLTMSGPKSETDASWANVLEGLKSREGGTITALANGQAMLVPPVKSDSERGEPLHLYRWMVARTVPPHHARIAIFTATVVPRLAKTERLSAILAMLAQEIAACTIADVPADPPPKRPWWKRLLG